MIDGLKFFNESQMQWIKLMSIYSCNPINQKIAYIYGSLEVFLENGHLY